MNDEKGYLHFEEKSSVFNNVYGASNNQYNLMFNSCNVLINKWTR